MNYYRTLNCTVHFFNPILELRKKYCEVTIHKNSAKMTHYPARVNILHDRSEFTISESILLLFEFQGFNQ